MDKLCAGRFHLLAEYSEVAIPGGEAQYNCVQSLLAATEIGNDPFCTIEPGGTNDMNKGWV